MGARSGKGCRGGDDGAHTSDSLPTSSSDGAVSAAGLCGVVILVPLFPECYCDSGGDLPLSKPLAVTGKSHEP